MSSNPAPSARPARTTSRRRLWVLGGVLLLAGAWLVHPILLEKALRYGLARAAAREGLTLEIGEIQSHLARPLVAARIRLRAIDGTRSRTAAEIGRVVVTLNWPWRAFFGERRWIRFAAVENLRGVFDCGRPVPVSAGPPAENPARSASASPSSRLAYLPKTVRVSHASFEILAGAQSYFLEDLSAEFNEDALGRFSAAGAEIHAGTITEAFGGIRGVTAWKNGTLYLADLALREGILVDNFRLDLARTGELALAIETGLFGGFLRGDLVLGDPASPASVSVWVSGTQLDPLVRFLGWGGETDGVLREARLTFRGDPDRPLDGQASLRLAAGGFRWKGRGWESLEAGVSLSGRRLSVSDFTFRQKENTLSVNGDVVLNGSWSDLSRAQFLLNATASVQNLGELAGLLGSPFDEMSGRMSLSAAVSGRPGAINGFVSAEGSQMGFRDRPIESGRLEVTLTNNEAQVTQCELWSGTDYVRGKGNVEILPPHRYSGEVQARVEDVAAYLGLLKTRKKPPIQEGIAQVRWQGDGSAAAHSGAFQVSLDRFVSALTPSGLTGRFAGTYSPQNLYFSGFELEQGPLRFSTRATLAASGVKLQDTLLVARGREIADAQIFLPLDPFALMAGGGLNRAVLADKPLYANMSTRGALGVRDLLRLAGNDLPAVGTLRFYLQASGNPSAPVIEGKLEGRGLGFESEAGKVPPSQVDVALRADEGLARLTGEFKLPGAPPATLSLETPLAYRAADGAVSWWQPSDRIAGRLAVPRLDLARIRPFFPRWKNLAGSLSGAIDAGGTAEKPELRGKLTLSDGALAWAPDAPAFSGIAGSLTLAADQVAAENITGLLGGGPFLASASASVAGPEAGAVRFAFSGSRVLLVDRPGLKMPANVEVSGAGTGRNGSVEGSVRFVDALLSRKLEVTPVLLPAAARTAELPVRRLPALASGPWADWTLNVVLKNENRFSLGVPPAAGEIVPDLRLIGTLGRPVPVGQIEVLAARAHFPFTTAVVPRATIGFLEKEPWVPQLDLRGTAQALDYEVELYAFGPLPERRLILRSDPALPQFELVSLLATGLSPAFLNPQNNALALRPFARQLEAGPASPARGRAHLWQTLELGSLPETAGLLGPRLSYLFRLTAE